MPEYKKPDRSRGKPKADRSRGKRDHSDRMTEAQHKKFLKAEKDGVITKAQHDKLSAGLLEAIISKANQGIKKKSKK